MFIENNENSNQTNMNSHNMKKYMHGHFWVKILVVIIVLIAVFKLGMCVGEFKAQFRGYGHHGKGMMMQRGYAPYRNGAPDDVIYFQKGLDGGVPAMPVTAPAAPAAPAQ